MADINDISSILGMLSAPSESAGEENGTEENGGNSDGIFGNIDPEMLIKLIDVFSRLNESDENSRLILALKPHLRKENRHKADRAAELMKLISVLSVFGEGVFFN